MKFLNSEVKFIKQYKKFIYTTISILLQNNMINKKEFDMLEARLISKIEEYNIEKK